MSQNRGDMVRVLTLDGLICGIVPRKAGGSASGVDVIVITGRAKNEAVLEYVVRGNEAQIGDAAFVSELRDWIRFHKADAARTRDGLFSGCTGNPSVPPWVGRRLPGLLHSAKSENTKAATQPRSSAGVAVFVAQTRDRPHWIEVGREYERFALQATTLGDTQRLPQSARRSAIASRAVCQMAWCWPPEA